ncbi:hypothetical protein OPU71_20230 [Niveibacterium sp. 24ML]|uniref:pullulanase-associated domain-containing protein n=1 Tax=Niveibacterium sp. 24ML TaxID=2985512 RepID=UPI00226FB1AA|nr:pullulanase-associated domain-containing protein [Niveibacterium sp. 24ML]MCX9158456.1 hypothetical protein [Niveibacterium sp. 24ML]
MKPAYFVRVTFLLLGTAWLAACGEKAPESSSTDSAAVAPPAAEQSASVAVGGTIGAVQPGVVRFHYQRKGGDYNGWGVYAWKGVKEEGPQWPGNIAFAHEDAFGRYVDIAVARDAALMDFLITDSSGKKDCATDQSVTFPPTIMERGAEVWILSGDCKVYTEQP